MILNRRPDIEKLKATKDVKRLVQAVFWKPLCIFGDPLFIEASKGNRVRGDAIQALGELGDKRAVEPLCKVLIHDKAYSVRELAAITLGKFRDPNSVDSLISALSDEHPHVRHAATWALGDVGDGQAVDPIGLLREKEKGRMYSVFDNIMGDKGIREAAIINLGKLGKKCPDYCDRAVRHLIKFLLDSGDVHREWSFSILGLIEIGEPAVKPLIAAVGDEKVKEYFRHFLDYKTGMRENIGEYALAWEKWWPYDIKSRIKPERPKSEKNRVGTLGKLPPFRKVISKRKADLPPMAGDTLWIATLECGHEQILGDMLLNIAPGLADKVPCEECAAEE